MSALGNKRTCNFHKKAPIFGAFLIRSIGLLGYDVDRSEALGAFLDVKRNFLARTHGRAYQKATREEQLLRKSKRKESNNACNP